MTEFFKFEEEIDIPFYNGTPELSKLAWIGLILGVVIYTLYIRNQDLFQLAYTPFGIISALIFLIPLAYATKGNLSMFFKKIRRQDIKNIILYTIAGFILSEILIGVLMLLPIDTGITLHSFASDFAYNVEEAIGLAIQLIGEELYKVFMIILLMALLYRFSKKRKMSMVIAVFITLIIFGATHEGKEMGTLLKVVIVQGFGSIFEILLYLKTKNVFVSYISHLIFDLIPNIGGLISYLTAM